MTAKPDDPLGYALRSSGLLFSELDRLGKMLVEDPSGNPIELFEAGAA